MLLISVFGSRLLRRRRLRDEEKEEEKEEEEVLDLQKVTKGTEGSPKKMGL